MPEMFHRDVPLILNIDESWLQKHWMRKVPLAARLAAPLAARPAARPAAHLPRTLKLRT